MNILVTGGAGYIGSHTVKRLIARGDTVTVLDDLSTGWREAVAADASLVVDSLSNESALADLLASHRVEAVIHFAARATVGEDARAPGAYYATNVGGTLSLLNAMTRVGVKRLIISSSCSVYGVPAAVPVTEATPRLPISVYGETKLAMENAVRAYGERYGLAWTAFRYFNAAGAADDGTLGENHSPETHLIPLTIRAGLGTAPPLKLFGTDFPTPDGTAIRDYVHVEDLAAAHLAALDRAATGAFNLGTGVGTSVRQILDEVGRALGKPVPLEVTARRIGDPTQLVAAYDRAASVLGWRPTHDLNQIITGALAWERKHSKTS